ncbi:MAG: glycosyltransferase family 4 protein [Myxococcota bacterium]
MGRVHRRLKHLVFPTFELHPVNPGGAGVLLAGAVPLLARAGHRVTVLCDFADAEVERARALFAGVGLDPGRVELVSLRSLAPGLASGGNVFEVNSERFARGLARLAEAGPIDYVEFPEYAGMALATLRRHREGFLPQTLVALRIHGSLEFIDRAEGVAPDAARLRMWEMEREGLRLADALLTPSDALGRHYASTYGLDVRVLFVSPPPMEELLRGLSPAPRLPDPGHFLFYGKLQEVKGCVQFAEAAVRLLLDSPDGGFRFTFIGRDVPCAKHACMTSACLARVIPDDVREAFEFVLGINRNALGQYVRRPVAAVVPSRFETFCLAAHELRAVGLPLIVPRIPGFVDWLNEATGCVQYDGTANGLMHAMRRVHDNATLRLELERAPTPRYPPFIAAYERLLREPPGVLPREA